MEFTDTATHADNAHEIVASALQWLGSVPLLPDVTIATVVGGGPAFHRISIISRRLYSFQIIKVSRFT